MKKLLFTLAVLFCMNLSFAQSTSFGLRVGHNWSELQGNYGFKTLYDNTDYNKISKNYFGLFLNYSFNKMYAIQPEINFKTRGFNYNNKQGLMGASWGGNASLNYIDIPILFNYNYAINTKSKVFINLGPSINILAGGGNYDYFTWGDAIPGGITHNYSRNVRDDFNKVDIGIIGGVGFKYSIQPKWTLFSEFRTSYSLTNSTVSKEYTDANTSEIWYYDNNHYLDISIDFGIAYILGK
jgi:hypothetical protein